MMDENHYPLLILDSLSNPIKSAIPPSMFNFPARAFILDFIIAGLKTLAIKYNTAVFIVNHVSKSDMNFMAKGSPFGGRPVKYNLKNLLYLRRGLSAQNQIHSTQVRRLELNRMNMKMQEEILVVLKEDYGFVDA